jgi:hypothetical protein
MYFAITSYFTLRETAKDLKLIYLKIAFDAVGFDSTHHPRTPPPEANKDKAYLLHQDLVIIYLDLTLNTVDKRTDPHPHARPVLLGGEGQFCKWENTFSCTRLSRPAKAGKYSLVPD